MYEIFLKALQEYLFWAIFVVKRPEKAQLPGCLMNVVKMADGRWPQYSVLAEVRNQE